MFWLIIICSVWLLVAFDWLISICSSVWLVTVDICLFQGASRGLTTTVHGWETVLERRIIRTLSVIRLILIIILSRIKLARF